MGCGVSSDSASNVEPPLKLLQQFKLLIQYQQPQDEPKLDNFEKIMNKKCPNAEINTYLRQDKSNKITVYLRKKKIWEEERQNFNEGELVKLCVSKVIQEKE